MTPSYCGFINISYAKHIILVCFCCYVFDSWPPSKNSEIEAHESKPEMLFLPILNENATNIAGNRKQKENEYKKNRIKALPRTECFVRALSTLCLFVCSAVWLATFWLFQYTYMKSAYTFLVEIRRTIDRARDICVCENNARSQANKIDTEWDRRHNNNIIIISFNALHTFLACYPVNARTFDFSVTKTITIRRGFSLTNAVLASGLRFLESYFFEKAKIQVTFRQLTLVFLELK